MKRKCTAIILILSLVLPMLLPASVFAETVYKEVVVYELDEMKNELLASEEAKKIEKATATFPMNAAMAGVGTEMIFHLFRQGNTDAAQTVTLGTFDITGEYGKHYEILVDGTPVNGKANPLLDGAGTVYNVYLGENVLEDQQAVDPGEDEFAQQMEELKDMASSSFDVTFAPGETEKELRIRAYVPAKAMGNREFQLTILDCPDMEVGENRAVAVTLYDERTPESAEINFDPDSAKVEDGYLSIEVERSGNTVSNTMYAVSAEDGTAKNGKDFKLNPSQLTFTPGVTKQKVHIPLMASGSEETKAFTLRINDQEEIITYTQPLRGATFKAARDRVDIDMANFVRGGQTVSSSEVNFGQDKDNSDRYKFSFNSWPGDGDFRTASIHTKDKYDFTGIHKIRFSASYRVGTVIGDHMCVYASNTDYYNSPSNLASIGSKEYGNRIDTVTLTGQGVHDVNVDRIGEYNLYVTADQHNGMGYIGYNLYNQDFDGDNGHFALIKKPYKLELVQPREISALGQANTPAGDLKFTLMSDNNVKGKTIDKVYRDDTFSFTYTMLVDNAFFTGYEILDSSDEVLFKRVTNSTTFCVDSEVLRYIEKYSDGKTVRIRPTFEREQAEVKVLAQDFAAAGMDTVSVSIDRGNRRAVYKDGDTEIATVTWDQSVYQKGDKLTFTVEENGGYDGDYHFDSFMMRSGESENLSKVNPIYYSNHTWSLTLTASYYEITPIISNENAPLLLEVKGATHGDFVGKPDNLKADTYTVSQYDGEYETSDIATFGAKPDDGYRAKWTFRDVGSNKVKTYYGNTFFYQVQFPVLSTDNTVTLEFEKAGGQKTFNFVPQVFMQGGDVLHQPDEDSPAYAPLINAQVTVDGKDCKTGEDGTGEVIAVTGKAGEVHRALIMGNNRRYIHDFTLPESGDSLKEEIKLSYYYEGPRVTSVRYYDKKGIVQNGDTIFLRDQTDSAIVAATIETNNKEITDVLFTLKDAEGNIKMDDVKGEINGNEYIWSAPFGTIAQEGDQIWVELQHREYDASGNVTALTSYGEVDTGYSIVIAEYANVSYVPDTGNTGEIKIPFWGNVFFNFSIKGVKPVITTSRSGNLYFLNIGMAPNKIYNFTNQQWKTPNWSQFMQTQRAGMAVFDNLGDNEGIRAASQSMKTNIFNMSVPVTFQLAFYIGQNPETLVTESYFVSAFFTVGVTGTYTFCYPFAVAGIPMFGNVTIQLGISDTIQIKETTDSGIVEINMMSDPSKLAYMPDNKLNLKFAVSLSVGAGVFCVASVSGGGTGAFNVNWTDFHYGNGTVSTNVDFRLELLLAGRTFSYKISNREFFNTNPYTEETVKPNIDVVASSVMGTSVDEMVMEDVKNYQQSLRETTGGLRLKDAYDFSRPAVVSMEDGRYAVVATIDAKYIKDYEGVKEAVMGYAVFDPNLDGGSFVKNKEGKIFNCIEPKTEIGKSLNYNPKVVSIGDNRYVMTWNSTTYDGEEGGTLKLRDMDTTIRSAIIECDGEGNAKAVHHKAIVVENQNKEILQSIILDAVYDGQNEEVILLYRTLDLSGLTADSTVADIDKVHGMLQASSLKVDDTSIADEENLWTPGIIIAEGGKQNILKTADIEMMKNDNGDGEVPVIVYHRVKGEHAGILNEAEEGSTNHLFLTSLAHKADGYQIDKEKEVPLDTSAYQASPQLAVGKAGSLEKRNMLMWKQTDRIAVADPIAILYDTLQTVTGEGKSTDDGEVIGLAPIHESYAGNNDDFKLIAGEDGSLYCFWTEGNGQGSEVKYSKLIEQESTAVWSDSQTLFETENGTYVQSLCAVIDETGQLRTIYRQTDLSKEDGTSEICMKGFNLNMKKARTPDGSEEEEQYYSTPNLQGIYASADVQLSDIKFEPLNVYDGINADKYKVTAKLSNIGDAASEASKMVISYLVTGDGDMKETVLGKGDVAALEPGEETVAEFEMTVNPAFYSKAYFKMVPVHIALYENYGTDDQTMIIAAMDGVQAMQEEEASDLIVESTYKVGVRQSRVLHAQVQPVTAAQFESLQFDSSNPDIATVDEHGVITGVKKGSCNVTVTTAGGISKTVAVQVTRTDQDTGIDEDTKLPDKPVIDSVIDDGDKTNQNTADNHPATGDPTMLWLWALVLLAGVAGINVAACYAAKRKY